MNGSVAFPARSPSPLLSVGFARAYIVTMRPYLLFVSGAAGIAGMSLGGELAPAPALALGAAFFLSYGFGQALTDCFQLDTDSISAPYRPLVRGQIHRTHVLAVSLVGLLTVGSVVTAANPWNLPLVVGAVGGLATYTRFKRLWWAGPFYNAWIVLLVVLMGLLAARGIAGSSADPISGVALVGTLVAVFFGYAHFVLAGYFKDVTADRATGYMTLPVTAGLAISAFACDVLALFAVGGAVLAVGAAGTRGGGIDAWLAPALLVLAAAAWIVAEIRLHRVRADREAHRAIVPGVQAFTMLLAAVACANRPDWTFALALFLTAHWLTLRARPMPEQV